MQTEEKEIQNIPLTNIIEPAEAVRTTIILERLEELTASIRQVGIIQPIHLKPVGEKFEIVAGHRRFLATQMLGYLTIPAILLTIESGDPELIKIHENYHREDISPTDEGKWFVKMKKDDQMTKTEIARFCGKSEAYVSSRINLINGDPCVLAALEAGQINFSQANELLMTKDDNIRLELLRVCVESGATTSALRLMRYDYEKSRRSQSAPETPGEAIVGRTQENKYLLVCPTCQGNFEVTEIYPLSVCRECHNGILEGAQSIGGEKAC